MLVHFSSSASNDLEEIGDHIHSQNPAAAYRFVHELRLCCAQLADHPDMGVARPELGAELRSLPYRRYVVFYTLSSEMIRIERILHGARDLERVFKE